MALTQGKNNLLIIKYELPSLLLSLVCGLFLPGSSEEELSGSLKLRAITHKAHSDMLRSEVRPHTSLTQSGPYTFGHLVKSSIINMGSRP